MNVVRLELKQISSAKDDRQLAELRHWLPGENQTQYKSRKLALAEISELYDFIDRDFTTRNLNLLFLGRRLFDWLDGTERWLAQAIEKQGRDLVLAIDAQEQLGGLPWEILADGQGFLVGRSIVPIRVIGGFEQPKELIVPSPDELPPAVLGWGRSVSDVGATAAAMVLYQKLSQGFTVAQALALTYRELLKADVPDWCLLRLYAKFDRWGKLDPCCQSKGLKNSD